jgi:hypothetical protein
MGKTDDTVRKSTETEDDDIPRVEGQKDAAQVTPARPKTTKRHTYHLGTLERLSSSMRGVTQHVAATRPLLLIYDNVNMLWKAAEQILGRTGGCSEPPTRVTNVVLLTFVQHRCPGEWDMCNSSTFVQS